MGAVIFRLALLVACLSLGMPAVAQEGHPLKGSWAGDWGSTANQTQSVLDRHGLGRPHHRSDQSRHRQYHHQERDAQYNGLVYTPGGRGEGQLGKTTTYVVDGKIENIALPNRSIKGVWSTPTAKGDFKVTRLQ